MKLLHQQKQQPTQRYNTQSKKKKFTRISRINTHLASSTKHRTDSRSSSLHSLVQSTTFLSKSVWNFNKMIASNTTANSNQFTSNSNKPFNSFNKNRRNDFNSSKKMIPNKNLHRQISTQRKSQPIQINRNNFQQQQYFNNNQSSLTQSFGINAAFSLANMFPNSELTVNLTNNEPRLVIFNNNNNSCSSNQMTSFNSSLPNNNYRESNQFFTPHNTNSNKLFHHHKQPFNRNHQHQQQNSTQDSMATNCNFNTNHSINSDSYKNKNNNLVTGFNKHVNQRYTNRFKYVKSPVGTSTKNSAPYNTTQYIMFDYSRRRLHDQECPNEQQMFSEEWNMALAANENATHCSNTSISKNLNDFNLDNISMNGLEGKRQFSLSEHNLEQMNEVLDEEQEQMQDSSDLLVQQLSSSL